MYYKTKLTDNVWIAFRLIWRLDSHNSDPLPDLRNIVITMRLSDIFLIALSIEN